MYVYTLFACMCTYINILYTNELNIYIINSKLNQFAMYKSLFFPMISVLNINYLIINYFYTWGQYIV